MKPITIKPRWIGSEDQDNKTGLGSFEESHSGIYFESFADFHYLCQVIDRVAKQAKVEGRKEVLNTIKTYVENAS